MAIKCKDVQSSNGDITETPEENKRGAPVNQNHQTLMIIGIVVAAVLVSIIICVTILLSRYPPDTSNPNLDDEAKQQKINKSSHHYDDSRKIKYIPRREWLAQPPNGKTELLHHPVPYVVICHTATGNCSNQVECTFHMQIIQLFHIKSRNYTDVTYNFLVGGDGNVYEGRGWHVKGGHTYGYNAKAIGISFIGTYNQVLPPDRQIVAAKRIIDYGIKKSYIASDYKLLAARQLHATLSPGLKLYENVKTWPHWAASP